MFPIEWSERLKILLVMQKDREVICLTEALQELEHAVKHCSDLDCANQLIHAWSPDLIVTDERLGREHRNAGLLLAERCRATRELAFGRPQMQTIVLIAKADLVCFRAARSTGAHVLVKEANFDKVVRYIQTVADDLATHRALGPTLFGVHGFRGKSPAPNCDECEWIGSSVAYDRSEADVDISTVEVALLNALMFLRRGQSPTGLRRMMQERRFFRGILGKRSFSLTAAKMNATRLREAFRYTLQKELGAPFEGTHFLPHVRYGMERYHLTGNWQLVHVPLEESHAVRMAKGD